MESKNKVLCDYKRFLIESFETDDNTAIFVYLFENKQGVMRYCKETGLPFIDGFKELYKR